MKTSPLVASPAARRLAMRRMTVEALLCAIVGAVVVLLLYPDTPLAVALVIGLAAATFCAVGTTWRARRDARTASAERVERFR